MPDLPAKIGDKLKSQVAIGLGCPSHLWLYYRFSVLFKQKMVGTLVPKTVFEDPPEMLERCSSLQLARSLSKYHDIFRLLRKKKPARVGRLKSGNYSVF